MQNLSNLKVAMLSVSHMTFKENLTQIKIYLGKFPVRSINIDLFDLHVF